MEGTGGWFVRHTAASLHRPFLSSLATLLDPDPSFFHFPRLLSTTHRLHLTHTSQVMYGSFHGASSGTSFASAAKSHDGAVTSLCFTPDGNHLLSSGSDRRIRLWDMCTGLNKLVHYAGVNNCSAKMPGNLAVAQCGGAWESVVCHPNGKSGEVVLYDVHTGEVLRKIQGHYSAVNACVFRDNGADRQDLFTAGQDGLLLAWSCSDLAGQGQGVPGGGFLPSRLSRFEGQIMDGSVLVTPVVVGRRGGGGGGGGGDGGGSRGNGGRGGGGGGGGGASSLSSSSGIRAIAAAENNNEDQWSDDSSGDDV